MIPDDIDVWDDVAHNWDEIIDNKNSLNYHFYRVFNKILFEEIIFNSHPGKIFEIGSGTGELTLELLNNDYSVTCFEPSKKMIEIAGKKSIKFENVQLFQERFPDGIPFLNNIKFDGIVSRGCVINYTSEINAFLKGFKMILRQNGFVFFDALSEDLIKLYYCCDYSDLNFHSIDHIVKLLKVSGFISIKVFQLPIEFKVLHFFFPKEILDKYNTKDELDLKYCIIMAELS